MYNNRQNVHGGIHMQKEVDRMMTFFNAGIGDDDKLGLTPGLAVRLAGVGFYRSTKNFAKNQPDDLVKCFYCMMEKGYWCKTDDPFVIHMQLSPDCRWTKYNIKSDNDKCLATLAECELIREKQSLIYDRCIHKGKLNLPHPHPQYFLNHIRASATWTYGSDVDKKARPQLVPLILSEQTIDRDDLIRLLNWTLCSSKIFTKVFDMVVRRKIWWAVNKTYVEANGFIAPSDKAVCRQSGEEEMCIAHNRMASFNEDSSPYLKRNAESVAMAGFYRYKRYNNIDRCRCFFCGVNVESWEEDDDPYHEHVKFSNACGYIRTKMNKVQIRSILYHYFKAGLMGEINQNFRRYALETMLDHKSSSQSDTVVKLVILDNLERRSDLLELMERFTITEIVNEIFYMKSTDDSGRSAMLRSTTRDQLETLLVRRNRLHTVCECQKARSTIGFNDRPNESGTQVRLPFIYSEYVPPTVLEFLSAPIPEPEPPKVLPYAQLPSTARANMFANEEYKNYTREQAIEKLENLLQSYTCAVCMSAPSCIVFMPCGHMVTCSNCNMGNPYAKCPMCRTKIVTQVQVRLCETQMIGCDV